MGGGSNAFPPDAQARLEPRRRLPLLAAGLGRDATANNHAFDLGSGGVLDTVAAIRGEGLASTGSGETLAVASAPAQVHSPAGSTAVVAFATGKVRPGGGATASETSLA